MSQYQDFRFQPPSRLEAVAQNTDKEEGNCIINRNHVLIRLLPSLWRMDFSEARCSVQILFDPSGQRFHDDEPTGKFENGVSIGAGNLFFFGDRGALLPS